MSFKVRPGVPSKLGSIPAFPSVARKLLALIGDEASGISHIAACIAGDSVLSGQLIKRANAADQARFCEVREVLQAAVSLGLDRTREISLAAATSVYASAAIKSDILRPCWHHTLACAIIASQLARMWGLRPAECYTAGLFHDIGRLGLLTAYPAEYEQIMAECEGQHDELAAKELEHFEIDHVEAGVWLARRWNLPESILEVIARQHELPRNTLDQVTAVQVACRVADAIGYGVSHVAARPNLDEVFSVLPNWTRKHLDARVNTFREVVSEEIRQFEGTGARESGSPNPAVTGTEPDNAVVGKETRPAISSQRETQMHWPLVGTIFLVIAFLLCGAALFVPR